MNLKNKTSFKQKVIGFFPVFIIFQIFLPLIIYGTSSELMNSALLEIENKDNLKAQTILKDLLMQFPDSPEAPLATLKLGYIRISLLDKQGAIDYFDQVTTKWPSSPEASEASLRAGNLYFGLNENEKGMAEYQKVKPESPFYANALLMMGNTEKKQGKIVDAMSWYIKAMDECPTAGPTAESKMRMAELFLENKDFPYPDNINAKIPDTLKLASEVYLNKRLEPENAIPFLIEVVARYPSFEYYDDCLMLIGRAYVRTGKYYQARDSFSRVINEFGQTNHANEAAMELVRIAWETYNWDEMDLSSTLLRNFPHPRGKLYGLYAAVVAYQKLSKDMAPLKTEIQQIITDPELPGAYKGEFEHLLDLVTMNMDVTEGLEEKVIGPKPFITDKTKPEWSLKVTLDMMEQIADKGEYEKAMKIGRYAIDATEDSSRKIKILNSMAKISSSLGEYERADELMNEAKTLENQ